MLLPEILNEDNKKGKCAYRGCREDIFEWRMTPTDVAIGYCATHLNEAYQTFKSNDWEFVVDD